MTALGYLEAVCRAHPVLTIVAGFVGISVIDKRPTFEPVAICELCLRGNIQRNRKHHGGVDKGGYVMGSAGFLRAAVAREEPA